MGMLPSSMLDWPGKICSVLFLGGCNFRCPYCHNPELVETGNTANGMAWEDIALFLRERSGWIDGVSVTGGEPTLHDDLDLLCERVHELGALVKLDTNGSRPRFLKDIIARGLVESLAMDLKTSLGRYAEVVRKPVDTQRIRESADAIMTAGIEHEFRCTVVPGLVGLEDLEELAGMIEGAQALVLQQFRSDITLDPSYTGIKGYDEELLLEWADKLSRLVPTRVRGPAGVTQG